MSEEADEEEAHGGEGESSDEDAPLLKRKKPTKKKQPLGEKNNKVAAPGKEKKQKTAPEQELSDEEKKKLEAEKQKKAQKRAETKAKNEYKKGRKAAIEGGKFIMNGAEYVFDAALFTKARTARIPPPASHPPLRTRATRTTSAQHARNTRKRAATCDPRVGGPWWVALGGGFPAPRPGAAGGEKPGRSSAAPR